MQTPGPVGTSSCLRVWPGPPSRGTSSNHYLYPPQRRSERRHIPPPMSSRSNPPPPPFPQPFVYPGSSTQRTRSTSRNPPRFPEGPPLESVRPPQHCESTSYFIGVSVMRVIEPRAFLVPEAGVHSTTHSYRRPSQPPPVHRDTHPHYNASAPAPPLTHSYSSSPPYSSSQLPPPLSAPSFSTASVSGGHGSMHAPGMPPLSPAMAHRTATFQPLHSEMTMPGAETQVGGGWSRRAYPCSRVNA